MIGSFKGIYPKIDESNFIAHSADVFGDVQLGSRTSVWFNATIRGDVNVVRIGRESNVQDNAVLHCTGGTGPLHIGSRVTIGHGAIVHGCTIGDNVLVGMGAVILDGATIGSNTIIGAKALVTGGTAVPPGSMVLGIPAKVVRPLSDKEITEIGVFADKYLANIDGYRAEGTPEAVRL